MEKSLLTNVCRACLTEEGEFQSVFVADRSSGLTVHIAEMIMAYTSVQITLRDGLPKQICVPCAQKAVHMYLFKQRCEKSDAALRQQLSLNKTYNIVEEQKLATEDVLIKSEVDLDDDSEELLQKHEEMDEDDFVDEFDQTGNDTDEEFGGKKAKIHTHSCDVCQKIFNRVSQLNHHTKIHEKQKQYPCSMCSKTFTTNDLLLRHQGEHILPSDNVLGQEITVDNVIQRELEENFKCLQCNKLFLSKEEFDSHTIEHTRPRNTTTPLKCTECNKIYRKGLEFTRHMNLHAAIKSQVSEMCNEGSAQVEEFTNHDSLHLGSKPHVCNICQKDELDCISPSVNQAAASASNDTLPKKSQQRYQFVYKRFLTWQKDSQATSFSENVLLTYFGKISNNLQPSTLWSMYSMLSNVISQKHNIDISKYAKLKTFLKRKSTGFQSKKAKVFTSNQIQTFLNYANDEKYLFTKVALIFGISGACRIHELRDLQVDHIQDVENTLLVTIPTTKTNSTRSFTIINSHYNISKKYISLRPNGINNEIRRFFLNYQRGKCTRQVVGVNKFSSIPKEIAKFLKLPDPQLYTSHSLRSSKTVLANMDANMIEIKQDGR